MIREERSRRSRLMCVGVLLLTAALGSGCAPSPEPTPTPTPAFASEEEAFAAAEETFVRYLQALNGIDASDPASFEPLFQLSSGDVEKADRENFSTMHAEGWSISGESRLVLFRAVRSVSPFDEVVASVCLDVSEVTVLDRDGKSVVSEERPDVYGLEVTLRADVPHRLLVDSAIPTEELSCPAS